MTPRSCTASWGSPVGTPPGSRRAERSGRRGRVPPRRGWLRGAVRGGGLDEPLPPAFEGAVDVMTAVMPYVPTDEMRFLPRDVLAFEPRHSLDGGSGGLRLLERVVERSTRWLRPGSWLLLEIGGDQAASVAALMTAAGFAEIAVLSDDDGDDRAIEGRRPSS